MKVETLLPESVALLANRMRCDVFPDVCTYSSIGKSALVCARDHPLEVLNRNARDEIRYMN
jgi:hypothetical protein